PGGRPLLGFSAAAAAALVLLLLRRLPRKFPASPIWERIVLTSVVLIEPSIPAECHASLIVLALANGLSRRISLTNIVFPGLPVAGAVMRRSPDEESRDHRPQLIRSATRFE